MVACHRGGQPFVITCQTSESGSPSEGTLYHPSSGQQDKSSFSFMVFYHFQAQAMLGRVSRWLFPSVALIDVRKLHFLARDLLHSLGQLCHLCPVLLVSRCHLQRQKMSQCIHSRVNLRTFALLVPVESSPPAALERRLHRAAVHNHRRRLRVSILYHAKDGPQIVRHRFKASGSQPPLRLLLNDPPRRKFMGHHPPGAARPHQPTQCVEHLPQTVRPLRRLFGHQCQVGSAKLPLFIADITRIRLWLLRHPKCNAGMYLLCTFFSSKKLMTGSNFPCSCGANASCCAAKIYVQHFFSINVQSFPFRDGMGGQGCPRSGAIPNYPTQGDTTRSDGFVPQGTTGY